MTGLEPRAFAWVIADRLAVSERIGGYGIQHRRVRREEEIIWLKDHGIDTVVSLLPGNQNEAAYRAAGLRYFNHPLPADIGPEEAQAVFETLDRALEDPHAKVLVHRDVVDDVVSGILAGYLIHAGLLADPILAAAIIQEIVKRPLGPEGRALIPTPKGS